MDLSAESLEKKSMPEATLKLKIWAAMLSLGFANPGNFICCRVSFGASLNSCSVSKWRQDKPRARVEGPHSVGTPGLGCQQREGWHISVACVGNCSHSRSDL